MKIQYTIHDVAALLGISADAIRLYEKEDLVTPKRNPQNSYRYYGFEEIHRIMAISLYRKLGVGIAQIRGLLSEPSFEGVGNRFDNFIEENEKEIVRLQNRTEQLRFMKRHLENLAEGLGTYSIRELPDSYIVFHQDDTFLGYQEIQKIKEIIQNYSDKYEKKIPIAIGGGIHDSESAAHAFSLGADAIQVATRFVTTEECDADIRYKEAYLNARKEDIVIVKSPVGMPGRAILNPFMKKVKEQGRIAPAHCYRCLKHCNPGTTPYCITQALINAAKGNVDDALLFCGAYAYRADHLETVKEVIDSLIPERV